jgi:DNA-binding MarR family transcriptional regulator
LRRGEPLQALLPKLTNSQLLILATAAPRADRIVLPLPKSLKMQGGALKAAMNALLRRGLVEQQPATGNAPAWRDDEDGRRIALVLTDAGLRAINADQGRAAPPRSPAARRLKSGARNHRELTLPV